MNVAFRRFQQIKVARTKVIASHQLQPTRFIMAVPTFLPKDLFVLFAGVQPDQSLGQMVVNWRGSAWRDDQTE